ncbi:temptin-like [Ruditapes philippinarum]|uniref:temptin-like n=1 Tax=Ruditapes philippinarum TaxID=129788 RepID=UPI00295ACAAC|nr:temptin-like [Ruditapes philippinarum]
MFGFVLALVIIGTIRAFPTYQDFIPNGHNVPNPCGGGIWLAVGHYNPTQHTIDKNPFGLDFRAAGHTWTVALCNKDSDGDGKTNGEELGDPKCVWTKGATPAGSATGHPGICNPVGSCSGQQFRCGCVDHDCVIG